MGMRDVLTLLALFVLFALCALRELTAFISCILRFIGNHGEGSNEDQMLSNVIAERP